MTSHRFGWAIGLLFAICAAAPVEPVRAQAELRSTLFQEAESALAAARAANAPELAPQTFARGLASYESADSDLARGRNMDRIRSSLATAANAFNAATEAAEIASVTLASLIKTRADAQNADAATFAAKQWTDASELFATAARRLEDGDIRGARSRAEEAEGLYRDAELTAIKAQYLSQTRALLAQAEQLRVQRTAPVTLAKAQALLEQAERELSNNRYDTDRKS